MVKPVVSESCASVPVPTPVAKPAEQPSAPIAQTCPAKEASSTTPPNASQPADSEHASGWETWVDMLGKDESWKKLMSQRTRLHKFFFILYDRVMLIFKNHIRGMGKEHTIRSLNDAKRYFFCFVDPDSYIGKRLSARMRDEIEYWKNNNPYRYEDDYSLNGKRSYWDGIPIPADAPPRPNDYVRWNNRTASWQ